MQQSVVGRFYGLELGLQFAVEENHHEKNFTCIILQMVLIHTNSHHEVDSNAASKQRNPVLVPLLRKRFMIDVPNRA